MKKLADDKLTAEMDKFIDDAPAPVEEEEEDEAVEGEDGEVVVDDDGEEVTVVEETRCEESEPVVKASKKSRLGVV